MSSFGTKGSKSQEKKKMEEVISITQKELDRLSVLAKVGEKRLSQEAAGALLEPSTRQIRRLLKRYRQDGAKGLIARKRGRPGKQDDTKSSERAHYRPFKE
ncbi:MAG: helix-turn-helix domain-containing protein [Verrucomicrobia bacterium]|nr:helix-turn-helix domain-containing protein [Verrucomicrobiota bacterium]